MKLNDFDYNLPKELIAQSPKNPRDHSRLLVLDKKTGDIKHRHFYNIIEYLKPGDVLVMNNSKVFPARLIGRKKNTEGKIEIFLHHKLGDDKWQCLVGGRRIKKGLEVEFDNSLECKIDSNNYDGTWDILFNKKDKEMMDIVNKIGLVPLPPYIKREKKKQVDKINYQTIYADNNKIGSVAAPTAGLHFTPELIKKLKDKGVQIEYITLHVGLGTFAPVKIDDITKHKMHTEFVEIEKAVVNKITKAKKEGRRIIAVGTTSVRTLEAIWRNVSPSINSGHSLREWVDIFIYPGYKFKIVDAMITNFHLPKSTLMMLVSAMAGKKNIDKAYVQAIEKKYRFYSYGDAMLIV